MKRIFYCREARRMRRIRIRYSVITSVAALAISAATGLLGATVSAFIGNLAGAL